MKDIVKWNARVSLVYAVGIWTMFGVYGYMQLYVKPSKKEKDSENVIGVLPEGEALGDSELPDKPPVATFTSNIVYRDSFVPYSTRVYRYIQSVWGQGPEK